MEGFVPASPRLREQVVSLCGGLRDTGFYCIVVGLLLWCMLVVWVPVFPRFIIYIPIYCCLLQFRVGQCACLLIRVAAQ